GLEDAGLRLRGDAGAVGADLDDDVFTFATHLSLHNAGEALAYLGRVDGVHEDVGQRLLEAPPRARDLRQVGLDDEVDAHLVARERRDQADAGPERLADVHGDAGDPLRGRRRGGGETEVDEELAGALGRIGGGGDETARVP